MKLWSGDWNLPHTWCWIRISRRSSLLLLPLLDLLGVLIWVGALLHYRGTIHNRRAWNADVIVGWKWHGWCRYPQVRLCIDTCTPLQMRTPGKCWVRVCDQRTCANTGSGVRSTAQGPVHVPRTRPQTQMSCSCLRNQIGRICKRRAHVGILRRLRLPIFFDKETRSWRRPRGTTSHPRRCKRVSHRVLRVSIQATLQRQP